ncbi:SAF domain-containing protein [Cohnella lupini]|uniref:SAF domain-containing protein n=1 Tax=Cohnella lupini TaxID=1294267 RepID=A0A3D9HTG9_9BACL|nr:SAF domain-containing protein [Cohnella lupini]RED52798.1 hypothetical protein DFP95_1302 [Cohnella lupini]
MNIEWNFRTIAIVVVTVIVLIGTNVGQYFAIWGPKQEKLKLSYTNQITVLQQQLDSIGPMVGIWTIKDGAEGIFPGKQIDESDFDLREIPESLVTSSFVLDPESMIGKYYKIGLTAGTPLSLDFAMDDPLDDTTREYDVVANVMPIGLKVGDYIDYRIVYPLGEDYIVLTHKRIEAIHDKTIKLKLSEQEIHFYQAALIDYFIQSKNGASLYLAKYLEPGVQKPAITYYAIPKNIQAIMIADPNIIEQINRQLNETTRTIIDAGIASVIDEVGQAVAAGRNEISGKIDSGDAEKKNADKAQLEAEAQAGALGGSAAPPVTPVEEAPVAPAEQNSPASEAPLLNIEKGVVE